MKLLQPEPISQSPGHSGTSTGRHIPQQLGSVASHYRRERLAGALRPFLVTGTAATLVGWTLHWIPTAGSLSLWLLLFGWIGGFLIFLAPRFRSSSLTEAAVLLDRRAAESDRYRSAWTFVQKALPTSMERLTISKAEQRFEQLRLNQLFPSAPARSVFPLWLVSLLLLGHWAWTPSAADRDLSRVAIEGETVVETLLDQLADRIGEDSELEELLREIETTDSSEDLVALLDELRQRLRAEGLDEAILATDLETLASGEDPESVFWGALKEGDLSGLAKSLRDAATNIDSLGTDLRDFLEDLPESASMESRQMKELAEDLRAAERALQGQDPSRASESLRNAAARLEEISRSEQSSEDRQAAARAIEGLQQRMRQEADTSLPPSEQASGSGAPDGSGSVAAPSKAPAEQAASGQVAGSTGDSSSGAFRDELNMREERTPLEARFEVELSRARSLVREPSGRLTRDLPSLRVPARRSPRDGRLAARQELEEPLTVDVVPVHLRDRIRQYLIAIHDGIPDNSTN